MRKYINKNEILRKKCKLLGGGNIKKEEKNKNNIKIIGYNARGLPTHK